MARDYYEVLGVPRNASQEEIKRAFRRLARQYHPDVSDAPDAEERFKEINEAYAVLSDPEKRAAYDRFGHAGVRGAGGVGAGGNFTAEDFVDLFEELFGFGFGFGGRRGPRRPRPQRGRDIHLKVTLTFEEAATGVEKTVEVTRQEVCPVCGGTGAAPGTQPVRCSTCGGTGRVRQARQTFFGTLVQESVCPTCGGTGEVIRTPCPECGGRGRVQRKVKRVVPIPAGVDTGTQIRIAGEGHAGEHGGPPGDLYLEVQVKPHPFFRRKGDDVLLEVSVNMAQAALGADIKVPTLDGEEILHIPPGTQPGQVFRLPGKGFPHLRRNGRGDQVVMVDVEIPTRLNHRQRELLAELAATLGTEVKPKSRARSWVDRLRDWLG